ncbi:MAG: NAD(P)H-flavin reductase [Legionella sp.]|nr:NAD(P)H-flavin reductase [Legionella sp.]
MKELTTTAHVERISPLTDSIIELVLAPDTYIDYEAGQYLQISSGKELLSYSIANAPLGSHKYELHIRHDKTNPYNEALFAHIKEFGRVTIHLPLGDCHINKLQPNVPIVFIAGGTGFAPIKAMIEQLLATGDSRSFELYWGARSQSDLYMDEKVRHWQAHVSHFRYFSLLPNSNPKEKLSTRVISEHKGQLKDYQFVIGGPFDMVYATRDALVAEGVSPSQLYSDAFGFEEKRKE